MTKTVMVNAPTALFWKTLNFELHVQFDLAQGSSQPSTYAFICFTLHDDFASHTLRVEFDSVRVDFNCCTRADNLLKILNGV